MYLRKIFICTALLSLIVTLTSCSLAPDDDYEFEIPEPQTSEPSEIAYTIEEIGNIHFEAMKWIRERKQEWLGYVYDSDGGYFLFRDDTDEQFKAELTEYTEGLPITVSYTQAEYTNKEIKSLYEDIDLWLAENGIIRLKGSYHSGIIYFSVAENTDDELKTKLAEHIRELPVCVNYLSENEYPELL